MLVIVGIVVVFAAVFGGYLLENGNIHVLLQPAELLIVGGAAFGIVLIANPLAVIRKMVKGAISSFRPSPYDRQAFLTILRMLFQMFTVAQRQGIAELETEVDDPEKGHIFKNFPSVLEDEHTVTFVCDSLRMLVIGATNAHELDNLMDLDIEVQRRGRHEPVNALSSVADALPGLGIVAAVLGVVVTMGAIGGAAEAVGQKVAAALVGTFLGILLCYGVVGPIAARLEALGETHTQFLQVIRTAISSSARGASPILAIEYARRSVPEELRPSFAELETTLRRDPKLAVAKAAADPAEEVAAAPAS